MKQFHSIHVSALVYTKAPILRLLCQSYTTFLLCEQERKMEFDLKAYLSF